MNKTKTYCRQRPDLLEYNIPALVRTKEKYIQIKDWCYCEQPDEIEDEEYNVKVAFDGGTAYVNSIDLEFKTESNEKE